MIGVATNSLSEFQFTIIGKQPSLANRLSEPQDLVPAGALSPTPTPPSSPRMALAALPSSITRPSLLEALTPQAGISSSLSPSVESTVESTTLCTLVDAQSQSPPTSVPLSSSLSSGSEHPTSAQYFPATLGSFQVSPPVLTSNVPSSSHNPNLSLATGSNGSTNQEPPTLSRAEVPPPNPGSKVSLRNNFDPVEQANMRFKAEMDECARIAEEARHTSARQLDQVARCLASVEDVAESARVSVALAEQRAVLAEQRLTQREAENAQITAELRDLRGANARLQTENIDLGRKLIHQEVRVSEACSKAQNAIAEAAALNRRHQSVEALTQRFEEARHEWEVRERDLLAQMEEQAGAVLENQRLREQVDEYRLAAEEHEARRKKELAEEKRRLELREIQFEAELAQQRATADKPMAGVPRPASATSYALRSQVTRESIQQVHAAVDNITYSEADPTVSQNTTSLPLATGTLASSPSGIAARHIPLSFHPSQNSVLQDDTASEEKLHGKPPESYAEPSLHFGALAVIEPLLAVKEEPVELKPKQESPVTIPATAIARQEPLREQSLDYVPNPFVIEDGDSTLAQPTADSGLCSKAMSSSGPLDLTGKHTGVPQQASPAGTLNRRSPQPSLVLTYPPPESSQSISALSPLNSSSLPPISQLPQRSPSLQVTQLSAPLSTLRSDQSASVTNASAASGCTNSQNRRQAAGPRTPPRELAKSPQNEESGHRQPQSQVPSASQADYPAQSAEECGHEEPSSFTSSDLSPTHGLSCPRAKQAKRLREDEDFSDGRSTHRTRFSPLDGPDVRAGEPLALRITHPSDDQMPRTRGRPHDRQPPRSPSPQSQRHHSNASRAFRYEGGSRSAVTSSVGHARPHELPPHYSSTTDGSTNGYPSEVPFGEADPPFHGLVQSAAHPYKPFQNNAAPSRHQSSKKKPGRLAGAQARKRTPPPTSQASHGELPLLARMSDVPTENVVVGPPFGQRRNTASAPKPPTSRHFAGQAQRGQAQHNGSRARHQKTLAERLREPPPSHLADRMSVR